MEGQPVAGLHEGLSDRDSFQPPSLHHLPRSPARRASLSERYGLYGQPDTNAVWKHPKSETVKAPSLLQSA